MNKKVSLLIFLLTVFMAPVSAQTNEQQIRIYEEKTEGGGYAFYADNLNVAPYTLKLSFSDIKNLKSDRELPLHTVIPVGAKHHRLLSMIPGKGSTTSFASSSLLFIGDFINARPDTSYRYLLPYAHGKVHKIDQGFGGSFSHLATNFYSVDFDLNVGDSVFAAREGLVVDIKEDSNLGGADPSFSSHGNFVTILHDDGSLSQYVHLQQHGVKPERGDRVAAGEFIAFSGATGWADGPHLHFMVLQPTKDGPASIPFIFAGPEHMAITPKAQERYINLHGLAQPAGISRAQNNKAHKAPDDVLGQVNIAPGEFQFTTVNHDGKILVVATNGLEKTIHFQLNINGINIKSSKPLPVSASIEGQQKEVIVVLQEKAIGKGVSFTIEYSITK